MPMYLEIILLIAPGFIAKETSRWFGNSSTKQEGTFDSVMSYFVYSLFSLLLASILLVLFGMLQMDKLTVSFSDVVNTNMDVAKLIGILILSSIMIGFLWQILLKKWVLYIVNKITSLIFHVHVDQGGYIFAKDMLKGEHLIIVKKEGKEIAIGRFSGVSIDINDKSEIVVDTDDSYRQWLCNENEDLKKYFKLKHTYINLTDHIIVEEYTYPRNFFDKEKFDPQHLFMNNNNNHSRFFRRIRWCFWRIRRRLLWWR